MSIKKQSKVGVNSDEVLDNILVLLDDAVSTETDESPEEEEDEETINYAFFENTLKDVKQELVDNKSRQEYLGEQLAVLDGELQGLVGQEPVLEFCISYTEMLKEGMEGTLVGDFSDQNLIGKVLETELKTSVAEKIGDRCKIYNNLDSYMEYKASEEYEELDNASLKRFRKLMSVRPPEGVSQWNKDLLVLAKGGCTSELMAYLRSNVSSTNKPYLRKYAQGIYDAASDSAIKDCLYDNFENYITREGEDPKVLSACDREKSEEPFLTPDEQLEEARKVEGIDPDLFDYFSPEYKYLEPFERRRISEYPTTESSWVINTSLRSQLSLELVPKSEKPYRICMPISREPFCVLTDTLKNSHDVMLLQHTGL